MRGGTFAIPPQPNIGGSLEGANDVGLGVVSNDTYFHAWIQASNCSRVFNIAKLDPSRFRIGL